MKKFLPVLFCGLCLLIAAPLHAKNNDLADAMQVIDTYVETYQKGDANSLLKLMSKDFQAETKEEWAELPHLFQLKSILLQKSEYEIIAIEKDAYDDEVEIAVTVSLIMPDIDQIMSTIPESVLDEFETDAELIEFMVKKLPELLVNAEKFDKNEERIDITLIKENGRWKVDEEY